MPIDEGGKPMSKICPMKFSLPQETGAYDQPVSPDYSCDEHRCAWWVVPYTLENRLMSGVCAIEMIAMKAPALYQV